MLIQNIDVNALKKNEKETSHDKGWVLWNRVQ